jgi:hypothetical protein
MQTIRNLPVFEKKNYIPFDFRSFHLLRVNTALQQMDVRLLTTFFAGKVVVRNGRYVVSQFLCELP